jgi:hypothetical protein
MLRFVFIYAIGLIISVPVLKWCILYINTDVLQVILVSQQLNDLFELGFRIFLTVFFGAAYFGFKMRRSSISLTTRQLIFSVLGLIVAIIFADVGQVIVATRFLGMRQLHIRGILPLWLTFPVMITYFAILLGPVYRILPRKRFW